MILMSEIKFSHHEDKKEDANINHRVDVTNLVSRLNQERKKERNSNIALSVAAVSAVTVFGIILSL
tara:strand:- start:503 stop:700 length:198 start_codon:yes stop_codon:yes gene_type:complete